MACKAVIFNSRCVPPFLPVASSSQLTINVWCIYLMIGKLQTYLIGLLGIFSFQLRFRRFAKHFALDFTVPSSLQLVQLFELFQLSLDVLLDFVPCVRLDYFLSMLSNDGFSKIVFNRSWVACDMSETTPALGSPRPFREAKLKVKKKTFKYYI